MKKTFYFAFVFVLISFGNAFIIEEGTILDPGSINLSATLGMNISLTSLDVFPDGWAFNAINMTFELPSGATVNISSLNYTSSNFFMNINGTYAENITNMTINFTVTNMTSNISILYNNTLIESNSDGIFSIDIFNETYPLKFSSSGTLVLSVFDEETDALITDRIVYFELISDSLARNYTNNFTANPSFFIEDIPNDEYKIQYYADGYTKRSYYVTITETSVIDLYLLSASNSSLILFVINNEKGEPLDNYLLKAKRYFLSDNAYLVVDMEKTDSNGETGLYLKPYDTYYQFIIEDEDGDVVFNGQPQKIYSSTVYLGASTLTDIFQHISIVRDVSTNISFNNNTGIISYSWNDASGNVQYGCIKVIQTSVLSESTIINNCASSSSGTVTANMTGLFSDRYSYLAEGYIGINPQFLTDLLQVMNDRGAYENFGNFGLFIGYILIITMFFLGLPFSFGIAVGYSVLSLIVLQVVKIAYFGIPMIIGIGIIGLIISIKHRM